MVIKLVYEAHNFYTYLRIDTLGSSDHSDDVFISKGLNIVPLCIITELFSYLDVHMIMSISIRIYFYI